MAQEAEHSNGPQLVAISAMRSMRPLLMTIVAAIALLVLGKVFDEMKAADKLGRLPEWIGLACHELGLALGIGGVVALHYERSARTHVLHHFQFALDKLLSGISQTTVDVRRIGFRRYIEQRQSDHYATLLNEATETFLSHGITLSDILSPGFVEQMYARLMATPGLRIRILILNPCTPIFAMRAKHGPYAKMLLLNRAETAIRNARTRFAEWKKQSPAPGNHLAGDTPPWQRFELRAFNAVPTVSCVANEDSVDVSVYYELGEAVNGPTFVFDRRSPTLTGRSAAGRVYAMFVEQFDKLWYAPETIDLLHDSDMDIMKGLSDAITNPDIGFQALYNHAVLAQNTTMNVIHT